MRLQTETEISNGYVAGGVMRSSEERFMLNGSGFPSVVANPVIIAPTFNVNRGIIDTN